MGVFLFQILDPFNFFLHWSAGLRVVAIFAASVIQPSIFDTHKICYSLERLILQLGFPRCLGTRRVSARKKAARLSKAFCRWLTLIFFRCSLTHEKCPSDEIDGKQVSMTRDINRACRDDIIHLTVSHIFSTPYSSMYREIDENPVVDWPCSENS